MATTTNYGWTTPDNTALVKDGAAAIRSLGSSIDTTLKAQIDAQIPDTLLTNTGDIIYASAANTPARLAIGSTNQVLKVTGGVPVWGSSGGGNLTETVFTSSNASWSIPTGVTGIWALVVGGGGGGGASSTATANNGGGGGGAGRVLETFFTVSGDTTLNITVGAGGAGATTQGAAGSTGSTSTIVGNTSSTTYASAAGGGGGGGGAAANTSGLTGASGGGNGATTFSDQLGGGGGFRQSAMNTTYGLDNMTGAPVSGGGGAATTIQVTGTSGGAAGGTYRGFGGAGIFIWNRALAGGGNSPGVTAVNIATNFGAANAVAQNVNGGNATANTGAGGGGASTTTTTLRTGGNGGSGLVVLRYVS
jgi:hypothetical protein